MTTRSHRYARGARHVLSRVAMVAALALAGAQAAFAQDLVKVRGNPVLETQILEETSDGVRYRTSGGGSTVVEWENIEGIRYVNEPIELKEGVSEIARANFADAVDPLSNLVEDARLREIFKPRVKFLLGVALAGSDQFEEALDALGAVVQDHPNSRYLVLAHEKLAQVRLAMGKGAEARKALQDAIKAAKNDRRESLANQLELIQARLAESSDRATEAKELYGTVSLARGLLSLHGKVGTARLELEAGNLDAAATQAQAVLDDPEAPPQVLSGAYNVLAGVHLERALKNRDPEELRSALFAALRGVVQFPPGDGDPTFEHERALFLSGLAFSRLSQTLEGEERTVYLDRAGDRLRELTIRFPVSFLKKDAESALQRVVQ